MTAFAIETETSGAFAIVTRSGANDGRIVLLQTPNKGAADDAMKAVRLAYNAGRRDEAAIRAAAFAGLMGGAPLQGGGV